jgi:arylsulfatase A-like enzyme
MIIAFLALVLVAPALAAQQPAPPNIVLILTDDLGYGDLGSYGATDIRTPHLDQLARDGARLTQFYANASTCTPTRAGLMTGRWQQRVDLEYPLGMQRPTDYDRGLVPNGRTLPQLMKNAGYATALVGKWHLGWKPEFSPIRHGFDYFFGLKAGFHDFYTHTTPDTPAPGGRDLYENDSLVTVDGYTTDLITARSVRFIERNARQPFFIDVSYNAPHWPYQVPDKPSVARDSGRHLRPWDDSTSTRADYVKMVERVDQGVGQILATLDRLGLRQNTIVIFTNDNGGEWLSRNAPLFHQKFTNWEGGLRVPMIVRWPGQIRAGMVSHQVGITMDLTRSILIAGGATLPQDLKLDGIDILAILAGRASEQERTLYWRIQNPQRRQQAIRSGDWKMVFDGAIPMLFNLKTDVGERENLAGREPAIAQRLFQMYRAWDAEVTAEARRATTPAR